MTKMTKMTAKFGFGETLCEFFAFSSENIWRIRLFFVPLQHDTENYKYCN